ncbi:MAG: response regulator, partial [Proteobacteria bacterium]|nr:response regulator [Pseudomonadota bacterium]
ALTQRLLAFARRQALEPKPIDLAELVRGMTDLLRRSIGPSVEISIDLPAGLPSAMADANQIELALLNLAVNARDAMPDGGTVAISLSLAESGLSPDLEAGRYLRLSVADTGVGMDDATLRRAIEPFFSTKEIGKGTGLGLSMIHGLALQLKGALRLSSKPGKGTRAELWLPVATRDAPAAVLEAPPAEASGKLGATLLFVDDDFLIRMSTASLLEDLGYTVLKAGSGAEALELLRANGKVDMMITDYAMPGMTGLQLAEQVRKTNPQMPILLATGYADLPARTALDLPRLSKPYHQRDLAETIGGMLT